jgi:hypothetical protein
MHTRFKEKIWWYECSNERLNTILKTNIITLLSKII